MSYPATPVDRIQPVSRQITRVFALLLIFANATLGLLLYFQFDQQLTRAWSDRYQVPLGHLAKDIEYGLQLGFSLQTMENLPQLLLKTSKRYPELTCIFVSDFKGRVLAHTVTQDEHDTDAAPLVARIGEKDKDGVHGLALNTTQGKRILAWSIPDPFGKTAGFVFMELPYAELHQVEEAGRQRLMLGITGIVSSFLFLSVLLFRLICRDLELSLDELNYCTDQLLAGQHCVLQHGSPGMIAAFAALAQRLGLLPENSITHINHEISKTRPSRSSFKTRIMAGALVLLLGSCVASTTVGYLIFHDLYLPMLYSQSRIIGQSLGDLVSEMYSHGIPVDKMHGMAPIFATLIKDFPQIAALGLYDAQGQRLQTTQRSGVTAMPKVTLAKGLDDPSSVSIPILHQDALIGMMRLDKVPHFFANRLMDIAMDVLALLVVSILIASELLVFMVRFLVAVPMEDLVRALRGEPLISQRGQGVPTSAVNHIEKKIRALVSQAPPASPGSPSTAIPTVTSSPLMSYVRPPLFLVVFADALSLSFFPLYVSTLSLPSGLLPKEMMMGLPISAFMLVWAVSLPMVGQWSDRVGRRRSLLLGAIATAVGLGLTAIATGFYQLVLIRAFTALGYGAVYISAQSYITDHTSTHDRTKGMATFLGGFFSGSLSGAALGGILADRIGYQATFGISALLSIMAAIFVHQFIEDAPVTVSAPAPTPARPGDFFQVFKDRCFLSIIFLTAIPAKILLTGFLYYSAPLYLRAAGASQSATGRVVMLYGLAIVLLGPMAAWAADRWRLQRSFIGLGAIVSALALAIPFWYPGSLGLLLAILMVGIAHSVGVAPQLAVITEHIKTRPNPPNMGKVIGIFRLSERVGNTLGPVLFGALLAVATPEWIFLQMGIYVAISALLFFTTIGQCARQSATT